MSSRDLAAAGIKGYYSRRVGLLEQQLLAKQQEWRQLSEENSSLRRREQWLFKSISTLGENLHFSALAAVAVELQPDVDARCAEEIAEVLAQDLQVYNLMHNVRSSPSGQPEPESYTARVLRDVITPECVQRVRASTNEQLLMQFRELVMRVSFHLGREERRLAREAAAAAAAAAAARQKGAKRKQLQQLGIPQPPEEQQQQQQVQAGAGSGSSGSGTGGSSEPAALVSSLDQVVDEYSLHIMLVSMVSFKAVQRLCLYSLDTLQKASPPPSYWADVLAEMQLTPDQMQQVSHAWACYAEKIAPHFKRTQELAQQVKELLAAADVASSSMGRLTLGVSTSSISKPPDTPAAAAAAAPMQTDAPQQQHGRQDHLPRDDQHLQQQQQQTQQLMPIGLQQDAHHQQQQQQQGVLPEHLQPRAGSASSSSAASSGNTSCGNTNTNSSGSGSRVRPWQEFGLGSTTGLSLEEADKLQELLNDMSAAFGAMSQLSHAHTFPVWNMFSRLQLARLAVASYPFMPNICQISDAAHWALQDAEDD
ncbi:hypothetical protein OEZ86_007043 [Tetradesmus obliquus]|nr:hypothetical protein OEZ86_007043 [Tetradesmus obliquus]